ncbi:MAG: hypothetical protein AAFR91_10625 [Pseudomonadota bacterium]
MMRLELRTRLITLAGGIILALAEIALAGVWDLAQSRDVSDIEPHCCEVADERTLVSVGEG